jgi:hypothetical protein
VKPRRQEGGDEHNGDCYGGKVSHGNRLRPGEGRSKRTEGRVKSRRIGKNRTGGTGLGLLTGKRVGAVLAGGLPAPQDLAGICPIGKKGRDFVGIRGIFPDREKFYCVWGFGS